MKTVVVCNKTNKPGARTALNIIQTYLLSKNYQVFTTLNQTALKNKPNYVIVLGGDGAMLHVANKLTKTNIPLIGVNFGHMGYSCQISPTKLLEGLKKIGQNQFSIQSYTRIKAKVINQNKIKKTVDALNEILVGGINRTVWLNLKVKHDKQIKSSVVVGDGLIFATQMGSTAYNLNAGGPILLNDAFSMVASNGLFESNYFLPSTKAFVASTDTIFEVKSLRNGKFLPYVVADGQRDYRLRNGDKVIIIKSSLTTRLIKLKNYENSH